MQSLKEYSVHTFWLELVAFAVICYMFYQMSGDSQGDHSEKFRNISYCFAAIVICKYYNREGNEEK